MAPPIDFESMTERAKFGFSDITGVGQPQSSFSFLTNEQLYSMNPERFNFYVQLTMALMAGDPNVVYRVLGLETLSRHQRQQIKDHMNSISKEIGALASVAGEEAFNANPANVQPAPGAQVPGQTAGQTAGQAGGRDHWRDLADKFEAVKDSLPLQALVAKKELNDPIFSPETMEATTTDRIIFIAVTFALRGFSLTFLEWALNNRMVNKKETAIVFYVVIYLLLFALWVIITNIGKHDLFFHVLFFYINTQSAKALPRIIIHVLLIFLLLPIPFILREAQGDKHAAYMTFEERRKTIRMTGNLTFLLWLMTSFVALRA
jgi:hypothetical protein